MSAADEELDGMDAFDWSTELETEPKVTSPESDNTRREQEKREENDLVLEASIGVSGCTRDCIDFVGNNEAVFPVAQHLAFTNIENLGATFITRHRPISCFTVAPSRNVVAVAEQLDKVGGRLYIGVYHVPSKRQIRMLHLPDAQASVVSIAFSKDSKYLVTQTGYPMPELCYWKWESEKLLSRTKTQDLVSRVRFHPVDSSVISSSGTGFLRFWKLSSGFTLKPQSILPRQKEAELAFCDHTWIDKKILVALTESASCYIFRADDSTAVEKETAASRSDQKRGSVGSFTGKMSLVQVVQIETRDGSEPIRAEAVCSFKKGFIVVGSAGYLGTFEITSQDKDDVFMPIKSFHSLGRDHFTSLAVSPCGETVLCYSKTNRLLSFPLGNIDMLFENEDPFKQFPFAQHTSPITAVDVCFGPKTLVVTASTDKLIRFVNYETMECELEHHISPGYGDPTCIAIHPSGLLLAVGFKEHVRIFDVLLGELREKGSLFLKQCNCVRFSHGGQYIACSSNIMINVYGTFTAKLVHSFTEHIGLVKNFCFNLEDTALSSVGMDGAVYTRSLESKNAIDAISQTFETCQLVCVVSNLSNDRVVVSGTDGYLREVAGGTEVFACPLDLRSVAQDAEQSNSEHMYYRTSASKQTVGTCLLLSQDEAKLFVGTSRGTVRVYKWPPSLNDGEFVEFAAHSGAVNHLRMSFDGSMLFSTSSADMTCLIHGVQVTAKHQAEGAAASVTLSSSTGGLRKSNKVMWKNDGDAVLVSWKEWKKKLQKIEDLKKEIMDLKSSHEYHLHNKDNEWMESLRNARAESSKAVQRERARYEDLQVRHEDFVQRHFEEKQRVETDRVRISQNLENEYEKRLWEAFRRLDEKSEALEALRQKTDAILQKQEASHLEEIEEIHDTYKKQVEKLEVALKGAETELRLERARGEEERSQQEKEYELEILRLKGSAENAVEKERQVIARKKNQLVQQKNKYDRLKSKVLTMETNKEEDENKIEKLEDQVAKLQSTLRRYEKNIEEREIAFREKEKTILNLRSSNKTLDNFRYVLDYRIEKLMEEKGPIQEHIAKLEAHIKEMYTELVAEFHRKKAVETQMSNKEMKVDALTNEVNKLRVRMREKDRENSSLVHIISTCVKFSSDPKKATQYMTEAYKTHILKDGRTANRRKTSVATGSAKAPVTRSRQSVASLASTVTAIPGATNIEENPSYPQEEQVLSKFEMEQQIDMLLGDSGYSPAEAQRQREYMQRSMEAMQKSLRTAERKLQEKSKKALQENAVLIKECNELRKEAFQYKQKCDELESRIGEMSRKLRKETSAFGFTPASTSRTTTSNNNNNNNEDGDTEGDGGDESQTMERTESGAELAQRPRPSTSSYPIRPSRVEESTLGPGLPRTCSSSSLGKHRANKGTLSPLARLSRPSTAETGSSNKKSPVSSPWQKKAARRGTAHNVMVEKLLESLDEANREIAMQRVELRKLRDQVASAAIANAERGMLTE